MSPKEQEEKLPLGADAPLVNPEQDAFGYAPFARRIANAVQNTPSPHGLVMAVHGQWGAGKSSFLNFVKYELNALPKETRTNIIDFNPWWFNDSHQLANQFLTNFQRKLPLESEALRKIGDSMAEYGMALGSAVAFSTGIPWIDVPVSWLLGQLKRKPKDIPQLKEKIAKGLQNAGIRFLFIIDDIDRLTPNEIRELFKVIKALADFPNVIYLLSFDRTVVAQALNAALSVDGEAYLEKIVQVPFTLPAVDKIRLQRRFFIELDRLINALPHPRFDQTYWGNVYHDGLDDYLEKPRDIVRVVNALSVTYPGVAGEVNPVDFIALEFLRVFEPIVYQHVRDHADLFAGTTRDHRQGQREEVRALHETCLTRIPEKRRAGVKSLLSRLFPRFGAVWNGMNYGSDWNSNWRQNLRVCSPDIFDIYFQFGVAADSLTRRELDELVVMATSPDDLIPALRAASSVIRPNGTSKASEYLDRLRDVIGEMSPAAAAGLLKALFVVGDDLLVPGDEQQGFMSFPNRWRISGCVKTLLAKVPDVEKVRLLQSLVGEGHALGLSVDLVDRIEENLKKPDPSENSSIGSIDAEAATQLKTLICNRLSECDPARLLAIPELNYVAHRWARWAGKEIVAAQIAPLIDSDNLLPKLLMKYVSYATSQGMDDRVSRRVLRMNPKDLETITDIVALEPKIEKMLAKNDLTDEQRLAGITYLKNMVLIRAGKEPDGIPAEDE